MIQAPNSDNTRKEFMRSKGQWHYLKRIKGAHAEVSRAPRFEVQSTVDAAWVVASRLEAQLGLVGAARVVARLHPAGTQTFGLDLVRPFL